MEHRQRIAGARGVDSPALPDPRGRARSLGRCGLGGVRGLGALPSASWAVVRAGRNCHEWLDQEEAMNVHKALIGGVLAGFIVSSFSLPGVVVAQSGGEAS